MPIFHICLHQISSLFPSHLFIISSLFSSHLRYDGIYKLIRFWPEKDPSGASKFRVWRFQFRRDDAAPAPWTDAGRKRTKQLGLEMERPEGWRRKEEDEDEEDDEEVGQARKKKKTKKSTASKFVVDAATRRRIDADRRNGRLWAEALESAVDGRKRFLAALEEAFKCSVCQELLRRPVTTDCGHNICYDCLRRSFRAEVYACAVCRKGLGTDFDDAEFAVNRELEKALQTFYPGYGK